MAKSMRFRCTFLVSVIILMAYTCVAQLGNGLYHDPSIFALPRPSFEQNFAFSQAATGYTAQRTIADNSGNSFIRVGTYRVTGSPYLLQQNELGYVYLKSKDPVTIQMVYDTYHHDLGYFNVKTSATGTFKLEEVDLFYIVKNGKTVKENLFFVNAQVIDPSKKFFLQEIFGGIKYRLYKLNKSDLKYVDNNFAQEDLREFSFNPEYYYVTNNSRKLIHCKPSVRFIKNEFPTPGVDSIDEEELINNPDATLRKLFQLLNSQ